MASSGMTMSPPATNSPSDASHTVLRAALTGMFCSTMICFTWEGSGRLSTLRLYSTVVKYPGEHGAFESGHFRLSTTTWYSKVLAPYHNLVLQGACSLPQLGTPRCLSHCLCSLPQLACFIPQLACPIPQLACPIPQLACPIPQFACPMPYCLCSIPQFACPMPYCLCSIPQFACPMPYCLSHCMCLILHLLRTHVTPSRMVYVPYTTPFETPCHTFSHMVYGPNIAPSENLFRTFSHMVFVPYTTPSETPHVTPSRTWCMCPIPHLLRPHVAPSRLWCMCSSCWRPS
jgi:hypothetical protein